MDKIIEVNNLYKAYGDIKAVNGLDFYVEKGKIFAFLGPNGAGKSTTIDIICTLLKQDKGSVKVGGYTKGKQDDQIRKIIGVVFQDGVLDPLLTVQENLKYRAGLYGYTGSKLKEAVLFAAKSAGVENLLKRPYGKLSGGQRRRCDIARALVNTPEILFLDEPTTGLDPQTRKSVWDTIMSLQKNMGMTVFFTTHYMDEAQKSDYVIIIDNGKIAARGTVSWLKSNFTDDKLIIYPKDENNVLSIIEHAGLGYNIEADRIYVKISSMDSIDLINQLKQYISGFELVQGTLDDVFINITGKRIRE